MRATSRTVRFGWSRRHESRPRVSRSVSRTNSVRLCRFVRPRPSKAACRVPRDNLMGFNLSEKSPRGNDDRNRDKRDAGAGAIGGEGSRHAPDRLRDDRDSDQLEAVQKTLGNRSRECGCAHCKGEQDQGRRRGEGEPRRKATQKAVAAQNTEAKADLAGGRSRKKLTERDQVGIGCLREPLASHHQFIPEIAEMGDRTTNEVRPSLRKPGKLLRPNPGSDDPDRRSQDHDSRCRCPAALLRSSTGPSCRLSFRMTSRG